MNLTDAIASVADRPEPSEAQIKAGNYRKGPVSLHGMRISVENPQGSIRRGKSADGQPWASQLTHHYGYIRGAWGRDKDHLDIYLGPDAESADRVFVVDQLKPDTAKFDEHKVMLGFRDADDAREAYLDQFPEGWSGLGGVTELPLSSFKKWAFQKGRRVKPLSTEFAEATAQHYAGGGSVKPQATPITDDMYAEALARFPARAQPHMGKRPEAHNNRAASAEMSLTAARAALATVLGTPGDLESLVRMITPGADEHAALPTTEFYREWLPTLGLDRTGPHGQLAEGVTDAAILATLPGPLTKLAGALRRGAARAGTKAADAMDSWRDSYIPRRADIDAILDRAGNILNPRPALPAYADGGLAGAYSAIDSVKRKLKDIAKDPIGNVKQRINMLNDMAREFNADNSLSTDAAIARFKGEKPTSEQLSADKRVDDALAAGFNPAGIIVWHGSPHKFDRFDASKIGTGEGAQSYGHGLYLAESPGVATTYSNLRAAPNMEFYAASGRKLTGLEKAIADDMLSNGMVSARAGAKANGPEWMDAFNRIKDETITRGNLYKVDLPDEYIAKMLDWDKPLFEQPAKIQEMAKLWGKTSHGTGDLFGNQFLAEAEARFGGAAGAADALRARGIPGIRYLDGASRGAGQGTSNYVVLPGNEGILTILERNGKSIKYAEGGGVQAINDYSDAQYAAAQQWAAGKTGAEVAAKGTELGLTADQFAKVLNNPAITGADVAANGYGTTGGLNAAYMNATYDAPGQFTNPAETFTPGTWQGGSGANAQELLNANAWSTGKTGAQIAAQAQAMGLTPEQMYQVFGQHQYGVGVGNDNMTWDGTQFVATPDTSYAPSAPQVSLPQTPPGPQAPPTPQPEMHAPTAYLQQTAAGNQSWRMGAPGAQTGWTAAPRFAEGGWVDADGNQMENWQRPGQFDSGVGFKLPNADASMNLSAEDFSKLQEYFARPDYDHTGAQGTGTPYYTDAGGYAWMPQRTGATLGPEGYYDPGMITGYYRGTAPGTDQTLTHGNVLRGFDMKGEHIGDWKHERESMFQTLAPILSVVAPALGGIFAPALSSITSPVTSALSNAGLPSWLANAAPSVVGKGALSSLSGGNFWDGAASGLLGAGVDSLGLPKPAIIGLKTAGNAVLKGKDPAEALKNPGVLLNMVAQS